jgi:ribose transport system substrate-binding protein
MRARILVARRTAWFAALAAVVVGCTGNDATNTGPALSGGGASGTGPKIAFVSNNTAEFWQIAKAGAEAAAKDAGVELVFQMPPKGTAQEQRAIIEDLLTQGVAGIAVSPNDAANQGAFFDGVAGQVPLITQDSDLPAGSKRICYIGTNNYEAGKAAGELVRQALPDGGRVVIFVGKLDVQNAVERRQGVLDALAGAKDAQGPKVGNYEILATLTDDVSQAKCKANAEDILTQHAGTEPEKLCLVGLWAYNPPAMLQAVKDRGLVGKVKIVGFDEDTQTLAGIEEGAILGTIVQNPYEFGSASIKLLADVVAGDKTGIPAGGIRYVPHRVISPANVAEFKAELDRLLGRK